ncbi:hypothetical protein Scep_001921 [Stephania cephalantha]|uniref:Uncharacterized protein n=1 Tax=Stephania cephalantha TaxID=152367 RepID=A0AAP0LA22_9MAGN
MSRQEEEEMAETAARNSDSEKDADGSDGAEARCSGGPARAARVRRASRTASQWPA